MPPRKPLHSLLGGIGGGNEEVAPVGGGSIESLAPPGSTGPVGIGSNGGVEESVPQAAMATGAPEPEVAPVEGGGGAQAPEIEPTEEDLELQQMQQALEDPTTPPDVRQQIQLQLEMAARRNLALGGQA